VRSKLVETCFERRRSAASGAHDWFDFLGSDDMKSMRFPSLGALVAAVFIASSFSAAPAEARTICKGSGAGAKCYTVKAQQKKFAKRAKMRAIAARPRRMAGLKDPWHGWGGSFHMDGVRYPGGNRSGPAFSYNNYEGGFQASAFWVLSDRGRH
jgi:hypothetical protein